MKRKRQTKPKDMPYKDLSFHDGPPTPHQPRFWDVSDPAASTRLSQELGTQFSDNSHPSSAQLPVTWTPSQQIYMDYLVQTHLNEGNPIVNMNELNMTPLEQKNVESFVSSMMGTELSINQESVVSPAPDQKKQNSSRSQLIETQNQEYHEALLQDMKNATIVDNSLNSKEIEELKCEVTNLKSDIRKLQEGPEIQLRDVTEALVSLNPKNFQGRNGPLKGLVLNEAINSQCKNLRINPSHVVNDQGNEIKSLSRLFDALQLLGALRILHNLGNVDVCHIARISPALLENLHPDLLEKADKDTLHRILEKQTKTNV